MSDMMHSAALSHILTMDYTIVITMTFVVALQSVFGVGILLFGTPILLIFGHSFEFILLLLLPLSIFINALQIISNIHLIEKKLFLSFLLFCMPFIAISLFLALHVKLNFFFLVGVFLILNSMMLFTKSNTLILQLPRKFEPIYFAIMGTIHGFSNLGGTLLSTLMLSKFHDKEIIRTNIAFLYTCFASIQLATLSVSGFEITINYLYILIGLIVYSFVTLFLNTKVSNIQYKKLFAIFLLMCGAILISKSGYIS